eukprot:5280462-Prymnesium_polylepis.1
MTWKIHIFSKVSPISAHVLVFDAPGNIQTAVQADVLDERSRGVHGWRQPSDEHAQGWEPNDYEYDPDKDVERVGHRARIALAELHGVIALADRAQCRTRDIRSIARVCRDHHRRIQVVPRDNAAVVRIRARRDDRAAKAIALVRIRSIAMETVAALKEHCIGNRSVIGCIRG